jgi:hypothetical protein
MLQTGLSSDLNSIVTLQDVTSNATDEMNQAKSMNGSLHWEVSHVYKDGSYIKLTSYGNKLFVQKFVTRYLKWQNDRFSIVINTDFLPAPTYKSEINENIFDNYLISVDAVLETVMGAET